MTSWVTQLPRLVAVRQESIDLPEPFEQFAARFSLQPGTVVLLSGTDLDCSRYHIVGIHPWLQVRMIGRQLEITCQGLRQKIDDDLFVCLKLLLDHFHLSDSPLKLSPFSAGFMGYLAYDLKDVIETLPRTCTDTGLPDIYLVAPSLVLCQDRITGKTTVSVPVLESTESPFFSRMTGDRLKQYLLEHSQIPKGDGSFGMDPRGWVSGFEKKQYLAAVVKIIQYLKAGDIYQANLAQRFETGFSGDPYALFLSLFEQNPAPFFAFIQAGDHQIVSTSPERFLLQQGLRVETRPIKGTIARGATPAQDKKNRKTLTSSIKDDAELTMIVDLMRNDLSRVTVHDSVTVKEHKRLEPYDNVFHLVSVVQGDLLPGRTGVDLLKASFPGGSITGCPKIRAMEIIDELEPVKRHIYTGSIGYISFHDTMDLSIAIRTATIHDQRIFFSVGGGIVYDSEPEKEFQETLDKGKTVMNILSQKGRIQVEPGLKAWINGKVVNQDQAVVPAHIPGFQYGAGVFETIRVTRGRPVRLDAHIQRMNRSWQKLFKTAAPDITWDRVITFLIRENHFGTRDAAVKIILASPGFSAAFIRPYRHRLEVLGKGGLDLVTFPFPRHSFLAGHKTLNYLYYDQAGHYAGENQGDEALILNPDQTVSETHTCNIMILEGRRIILPASDHVLPGVTQAAAIGELEKQGYVTYHHPLSVPDLMSCANIILTNALMGAVPVNHVDGIRIVQEAGVWETVRNALEENL
ncbi:MAG: aminodeoxychorismate synthase component I [Desulfotignum sp.]|nr:aminodeoxychorismate synthase component I [Desulfotignum sp.]